MKILLIQHNIDILGKIKSVIPFEMELAVKDFSTLSIDDIEPLYPELVLVAAPELKEEEINLIKRIKNIFPEVSILIMCSGGLTEYVLKALKTGASGFCPCESIEDSLLHQVEYLLNGKAEIPLELANQLADPLNREDMLLNKANNLFTTRELLLLTMIKDSFSYERIALQLDLSIDKIRQIVRNIYRKIHNFYNNQTLLI